MKNHYIIKLKRFPIFILITTFIIFFNTKIQADTFCVSNASELQSALTTAATNSQSDTIKVVQGTYNGNFIFSSAESYSLVIKGGYFSDCTSRNLDPNNTVFDGGNQNTVLVLVSNEEVDFFVEGITVQNGQRDGSGPGMFIITTGMVDLNQNIVKNNLMIGDGNHHAGW
jgi:hypothetical protein